jgi:outer membrane murein-binding lipoprotein Lpp
VEKARDGLMSMMATKLAEVAAERDELQMRLDAIRPALVTAKDDQ